jgi:hypothetical protein
MSTTKDIIAGAVALEYSDVIIIVAGVAIVGIALYTLEQYVEGEANAAFAPVQNLLNNLSGPADGQSWYDYFFGG